MMDTQSATGGFPGVAPLAQYGGGMMRGGWGDARKIDSLDVCEQYGDTALKKSCLDLIEKY